MTRADCLAKYYELSRKAGDIIRQLGFAGIAMVWLFRIELADGRYQIPRTLVPAAFLIVLSLTCDLLHYLVGSAIWASYNRLLEYQGVPLEAKIKAPSVINWPTLVFYWSKAALMVTAYTFILAFLFNNTL